MKEPEPKEEGTKEETTKPPVAKKPKGGGDDDNNKEEGKQPKEHYQGQRQHQQTPEELRQMSVYHQQSKYYPNHHIPSSMPTGFVALPYYHHHNPYHNYDYHGYHQQQQQPNYQPDSSSYYPTQQQQQQQQQQGQDPNMELPPGLLGAPSGASGLGGSTDPLESQLGQFPCVRLKSLPFDATLEDILTLFQGLIVMDVLIMGQGEAFVLFSNLMDYQMATQREGQSIGRRYVEIVSASRKEYREANTTQYLKEHPGFLQQAMRGGRGPDQQSGGHGNQMTSDSSAMWGGSTPGLGLFHQRDRDQHQGGADSHMGGHGPIGMVPGMGMGPGGGGGPDRGLGPGMSGVGGRSVPGGPPVKRTGGGIQVGEHTGFLRMRGLPFSSTKDDIFKFFDGYNAQQETIVLTYRSDGRATGEAYVGFLTPDDSKRAMDLHRKSMGTRYIELFISNKEEHTRAIQRFGNR